MRSPDKASGTFSRQKWLRDIAAGICLALLATLLRLALDPWLGKNYPFAFAFFATVVAAFWRGALGGIVSTVAGLTLASWLIAEPRGALAIGSFLDSQKLLLSIVGSTVISIMGEFTVRTRRRNEEAQRKLACYADELEKTVEARTAKLRETVNELEGFSYSITHDLRAPLRAMQGFAEFLREDYEQVLDEKGIDYLRRLNLAANRMDKLICDMLVYSRALRADLKLEPVDVDKLVRGMIETYPNLHEPTATVRIDGQLPKVIANEAAMTQCFSNLLDNAVKFVAPGVKPVVVISAEKRDEKIRFWVSDNGIGIDEKYLEVVFGMFERLSKEYGGTGIGLPLVRKAAERMGGAVGVDSVIGKGSRFWLEFHAA